MTVTPVEELVDGGQQHHPVVTMSSIHVEQCARGTYAHDQPVHPGYSFCRDCLAWLRCECDDDPLDDGPALAKLQTPPDSWVGYVEMLRGNL
jgi:hypothetical protein